MHSFFITGTDTEVGKTYVTRRLLLAANAAGKSTLGYKPVSAGCELLNGQLVNEDAQALQQAASIEIPLQEVNPIAFEPPIAPHIAAEQCGRPISSDRIISGYHRLQSYSPDVLLVEGAGGWRLPIGAEGYLSGVVKALELDVILVVGMRLGCLNHAVLTAEAIQADGLHLKGWIANQLSEPMPYYQQNLATLKSALPAPMLAEIGFRQSEAYESLSELADIFS
ncbi:dethiobiotin synthase [Alteromonas aestuariivivens]|uniref:ATP-dependent dethiobiotin synthetase BioD n=1 Tax=Alteromonas aestuariivivens TaxID=1938339 RepID=A0A3D8M3Q2_9ALTE|nr:dethiobiotin synthase [Alteromonas aestuariivivens]RDV24256.1 dethiobiotin synthase [Alteromonas aestuariivivens]